MTFTSPGQGLGSTFSFELPLYLNSSADVLLDSPPCLPNRANLHGDGTMSKGLNGSRSSFGALVSASLFKAAAATITNGTKTCKTFLQDAVRRSFGDFRAEDYSTCENVEEPVEEEMSPLALNESTYHNSISAPSSGGDDYGFFVEPCRQELISGENDKDLLVESGGLSTFRQLMMTKFDSLDELVASKKTFAKKKQCHRDGLITL